jgi:hypothetical protein
MELKITKNIFITSFLLLAAFFLFSPNDAKASFINFKVNAERLKSNGTMGPMSDFKVSMASTKNSSNGAYWSSGGTCVPCQNESASVTTGSDGSSGWSSGLACGASDCGEADTDDCNPFRISGSVPSPGSYDSDISKFSTPWGSVAGTSFSVDKEYDNNDNPTWSFAWYGRKDTLTDASLNVTVNDNDMDCSELQPNTAKVTLTADVTHTQWPTSPEHTIEYNFNFGDGHTSGWQTSKSASHVYDKDHWSSFFGVNPPNSKTLNVKVDIRDKGFYEWGQWNWRYASATGTATINKYTRTLYCGNVTAAPTTGTIPLTVNFNGYIEDNWLCGSVPQYDWNFGDGTTKVNAGPKTIYTYIIENVAGFNPSVTGKSAGLSKTCPLGVNIRSQEWSDTNFQEVAP